MRGAAMPKYLFCGGLQPWEHKYIWWLVGRFLYGK